MMRLTPDAIKRLFYPTVEKIKSCIGDVLNSPDVKGIKKKKERIILIQYVCF